MDYIQLFNAFWVGGSFCAIAQIIIDKTKLTPARIMVLYVICGVILSGLGIYQYIVDYAGAGATVPIIGFGHTLAQGAAKAVDNKGIWGALCGGATSAACGISAAIFLGFICAVIFKSKPKK
ncbi:MAG: stage V sporulation protein AE [Clostridia bacterium]|nr:stage V sporulation protein AE [Clostridia bacterium]